MNGLATVLHRNGDYQGAETLFRDALSLRRKLLGEDHPDVAKSAHGLATLLRDTGNYAEAEPLYQQALSTFRGRMVESRPQMTKLYQDLVHFYEAWNKPDEADRYRMQ